MTRRVETDAKLKLFLLDLSKKQLAGDLESAAQLRHSAFYKLLVEQPAGSPPWGLIVGNYQFAATLPDVEMLGRIAQIAARAERRFWPPPIRKYSVLRHWWTIPIRTDREPLEPAAAEMWPPTAPLSQRPHSARPGHATLPAAAPLRPRLQPDQAL